MACDGNNYDPRCPLVMALLEDPATERAYEETRQLALSRSGSYPFLAYFVGAFNALVTQNHAMHRAYHIVEANGNQGIQHMIDIINGLPGGQAALAKWKDNIHVQVLDSISADPALVVPGAKA